MKTSKHFSFRTLSFFLLLIALLESHDAPAQTDSLRMKIADNARLAKGNVGVALLDLEKGDTLSFNGESHFPMQSVFKFPLAMAVLHQVDRGVLSLDQKIHIKKKDLLPDTWSPLRDKYPEGDVEVPLREILVYTISQSDNNGCDILFRLLGGPGNVDTYIHSLGVEKIAIAATEEEMHKDWNVQFTNWNEPLGMTRLLDIFFKRKILSAASSDFLWETMSRTTTGPKRIKGLLPLGVIVAHKSGSSGVDDKGIAAATNDVGIVTLPDGRHFAIVVYVSNSAADEETRDLVIAKISKAAWDYFVEH